MNLVENPEEVEEVRKARRSSTCTYREPFDAEPLIAMARLLTAKAIPKHVLDGLFWQ